MAANPKLRGAGEVTLRRLHATLAFTLLLPAWLAAASSFSAEPTTDEPAAASDNVAEDPADETDSRPVLTYMGRQIAPPMHFSGAGWLTRASRVREENPAKLLQVLDLKKGQVVCDFGCGNGYHTVQLAKRVGPKG